MNPMSLGAIIVMAVVAVIYVLRRRNRLGRN